MSEKNFFDQTDLSGNFDTSDIEANKAVSVVGYIPVLFLVPLLAAPTSRFAKFHANQGLILTLASITVYIASAVLGAIFRIIPLLNRFVPDILGAVAGVAILAFMVIGMVTAASGKAKKLPFIGHVLDIIH